MKFKNKLIAILADTHFGVHQNSETWHQVAKDFAVNFKKDLIKRGIQDIVIPGDIFHNRNEISVNTIHVVNEIFNIWKEFNIFIIPGNHDTYYKDRADVHSLGLLNGWDNIFVFSEPTSITAFDKQISFCPWAGDYTKLPYSDILFGHFAINNFELTSNIICDNGIESSDILKYAKFVITGHFHATDIRKYDNGTIMYIGCPYEMYWGDYGDDKGYYIFNLETMEYEFIINKLSPRHKKLKLSEMVVAGKIPDYWESEIYNNIVSFEIDRIIDTNKLSILCTKLQSMGPMSFKVNHNIADNLTAPGASLSIDGIDIQSSIREFIELLDIPNKKDVMEYTIDLYNNCI